MLNNGGLNTFCGYLRMWSASSKHKRFLPMCDSSIMRYRFILCKTSISGRTCRFLRHGIAIFPDIKCTFFLNQISHLCPYFCQRSDIHHKICQSAFTLNIPFLIFHLKLFSGKISKLSDLFYCCFLHFSYVADGFHFTTTITQ